MIKDFFNFSKTKNSNEPNVLFYVNKPISMIKHADRLIFPLSSLSYSDRNFLKFELLFFYYFVYDYTLFHKLDDQLRLKIMTKFLENVQSFWPDEFHDINILDPFYETRIYTYFGIIQETKSFENFIDKSSEYINIILSYSMENNVFTCHNFELAKKELKPKILFFLDLYTDELKEILGQTSYSMMIYGIDPSKKH